MSHLVYNFSTFFFISSTQAMHPVSMLNKALNRCDISIEFHKYIRGTNHLPSQRNLHTIFSINAKQVIQLRALNHYCGILNYIFILLNLTN